MFERYTEKARRVIFYAVFEAREFGSAEIGTEHLLIGLLREDKAHLHLYLPSLASGEPIRAQIEAGLPRLEKNPPSVDLPLSNPAKLVLAYAAEEAEGLEHKHIGTEHLFLGLLREEKCIAAKLMREHGADLKRIRKALAAAPPRPLSGQEEADARAAFGRILDPAGTGPWADKPRPAKRVGFGAYTESARRAIFFARDEAAQFGSPYIESEHLLLGLMREGKEHQILFFGSAEGAESVRAEVEANTFIRKDVPPGVDLPLSNECRRALAYGAEEAERLGKERIGVEHLLLGLLREVGCFAAQLLLERGADLERIRAALSNPPLEPPAG